MNTNNPVTEISAVVLAALLILAAALLVYAGKIDFTAATLMLTLAAGIFAGNLALKAPSPTQQAQLQTLTTKVLDVLPTVVAAVAPAQPTVTPAPVVQAQPPPITIAADTPWTNTATATAPSQFQPVPFPTRVSQDTAGFPVPQ